MTSQWSTGQSTGAPFIWFALVVERLTWPRSGSSATAKTEPACAAVQQGKAKRRAPFGAMRPTALRVRNDAGTERPAHCELKELIHADLLSTVCRQADPAARRAESPIRSVGVSRAKIICAQVRRRRTVARRQSPSCRRYFARGEPGYLRRGGLVQRRRQASDLARQRCTAPCSC